MIIYQNIPALNSWRNLTMTNSGMAKSLEKLSSGLRINRAADDAAGLAISEKMRAQVRGLNQAVRNAQDGISLIQTAEGALNETHAILQRMRELAVQAANGTLTSSDRGEIQKEVNQLTDELNRIANTTEFNTKKLLDGSASALVSSDKLTTQIFMRDGLRTVDQFGQKLTNSGNYQLKIGIKELGQAEVQKSDIFNVKHAYNGIENLRLGIASSNNTMIGSRDYVAGSYSIGVEPTTTGAPVTYNAATNVTQQFTSGGAGNIVGASTATFAFNAVLSGSGTVDANLNSLIEITNIAEKGTGSYDITYRVSTHKYGIDGSYEFKQISTVATVGTATSSAAINLDTGLLNSVGEKIFYEFNGSYENANLLNVGDKAIVNTNANSNGIASVSNYNMTGVARGDTAFHTVTQTYSSGYFDKTQRTFNLYSLDTVSGKAFNGSITVGFDNDYAQLMTSAPNVTLAAGTAGTISAGVLLANSFEYNGVSYTAGTILKSDLVVTALGSAVDILYLDLNDSTATGAVFDISPALGRSAALDTKLYDIDKFWDANGNFLLSSPQQITLVQGDGKKAGITLDSNDTIFTLQQKLNNAVAVGLGQAGYVDSTLQNNFVKYVYNSDDEGFKDRTGYSVDGTLVIQSAIAGKSGEIRFVGDDNLINALSLANIRNSSENTFNVWVKDAHSTNPYDISPNATIAGNLLVGVVHSNVDVMFDSNASIKTVSDTNSATGLFQFSAETDFTNFHTTTVHLADNTLVFQIGANPNQDVNAAFGNMSAYALGVNNVLLTDRVSATDALTKIDMAINRVSGERAKMGAIQNRLEHTINNLGVAAENLSAAESRIRDVDMAAEMMNLTKLQILAQAGTAMMAQANAMPQMVLRLLG